MILYTLKCADGHAFEAWFKDSAAYDTLRAAGQVTCADCGSVEVEKTMMAPAISGGSDRAAPTPADAPLIQPATKAEAMLRRLAAYVRRHADHVGRDFAAEARRIHTGEAEERAIWGEASAAEAKALADDGIPIAPLPPIMRHDD